MPLQDRKQREFQRREEDILDATLELCSQPSWASVTVEQIAEKADIGKGTVYKHFKSKDELLFRLTIRFYQGLLVELREAVGEGNPLEQHRHLISYALDYHIRHREYRYVVEYCEGIDFKERAEASWKEELNQLDQAFQDWGGPMIQAGIDAGLFQDRPIQEIMLGLHACFKGAISMIWIGDQWCPYVKPEVTKAAATEFMLAGLQGRPS